METVKHQFRPCGDCTVCCEGHLIGKAHSNYFGQGRKCVFLVKKECTVYQDRPDTCRKYQCAWSQRLVPDWMRPDQSGVMISVQVNSQGQQYLKAIEIRENIDARVYPVIEEFCQQQQTYFEQVKYENRNT